MSKHAGFQMLNVNGTLKYVSNLESSLYYLLADVTTL